MWHVPAFSLQHAVIKRSVAKWGYKCDTVEIYWAGLTARSCDVGTCVTGIITCTFLFVLLWETVGSILGLPVSSGTVLFSYMVGLTRGILLGPWPKLDWLLPITRNDKLIGKCQSAPRVRQSKAISWKYWEAFVVTFCNLQTFLRITHKSTFYLMYIYTLCNLG